MGSHRGPAPHAVYRTWLQQARLLAHTWGDPHLYEAHAFFARRHMKRLLRHTMHESRRWDTAHQRIRQLMQANVGWPHGVVRALEQAYGRRGRFRHELLSTVKSPQPSPPYMHDNARYPRRLRKPFISQTLSALLFSYVSHRGSAPREGAMKCPPTLATALESINKIPGRKMSRRRIANLHWRWLTMQLERVRAPLCARVVPATTGAMEPSIRARMDQWTAQHAGLFHELEIKAKPSQTTVPRRAQRQIRKQEQPVLAPCETRAHPPASEKALVTTGCVPRYVAAAQHAALSAIPRRLRRKRVDYLQNSRARRRMWAWILANAPIITLHAREQDSHLFSEAKSRRTSWDMMRQGLAILSKSVETMKPSPHVRISLSPYALYSGKGPRHIRAHATLDECLWMHGGDTPTDG